MWLAFSGSRARPIWRRREASSTSTSTPASSSSASYDFRFSDEGQVTDVDLRLVNGSVEENDSFDVEFDDDGRIATLENNDGDVWEFEYDDEPVQGVTFGAAALPPVLDIAGRQAPSVVGSPTHLVY